MLYKMGRHRCRQSHQGWRPPAAITVALVGKGLDDAASDVFGIHQLSHLTLVAIDRLSADSRYALRLSAVSREVDIVAQLGIIGYVSDQTMRSCATNQAELCDERRMRLRSVIAGGDEAGFVGEYDGLHSVAQPEFHQHTTNVGFHGGFAEDEVSGDLGVGPTLGNEV